jgi:hypothetical protein
MDHHRFQHNCGVMCRRAEDPDTHCLCKRTHSYHCCMCTNRSGDDRNILDGMQTHPGTVVRFEAGGWQPADRCVCCVCCDALCCAGCSRRWHVCPTSCTVSSWWRCGAPWRA